MKKASKWIFNSVLLSLNSFWCFITKKKTCRDKFCGVKSSGERIFSNISLERKLKRRKYDEKWLQNMRGRNRHGFEWNVDLRRAKLCQSFIAEIIINLLFITITTSRNFSSNFADFYDLLSSSDFPFTHAFI